MAATPGIQRLAAAVYREFPDVSSFGVYNPRHIGSASWRPWSQHAGCEPARGWWGNAWDMTSPASVLTHGPRGPSNPVHMAYLDLLYLWLRSRRDSLRINELLWRVPDHFDHIHGSTWPKMADDFWRKHPTKGGAVLTIAKDGTRSDTYRLEADMAQGLTQGDSGKQVVRLQRLLNALASPPVPALKVDGVYGALTASEVERYQIRREIPEPDGAYDAFTRADLERDRGPGVD